MTTTIDEADAAAMLDEAQDLTARLRALAGRAEGAFVELSCGEDVTEPTVVQRILMAVGAANDVPLVDLARDLDFARMVLAGEIVPFEEDDTVSTVEILVDQVASSAADEEYVIFHAEVLVWLAEVRDEDEEE